MDIGIGNKTTNNTRIINNICSNIKSSISIINPQNASKLKVMINTLSSLSVSTSINHITQIKIEDIDVIERLFTFVDTQRRTFFDDTLKYVRLHFSSPDCKFSDDPKEHGA